MEVTTLVFLAAACFVLSLRSCGVRRGDVENFVPHVDDSTRVCRLLPEEDAAWRP